MLSYVRLTGGKKPVKGEWQISNDPEVISTWTGNNGLLTGTVNGIVVRDYDGPEGLELARAEFRSRRELFQCLVRTPNGLHVYTRMPEFPVPNAVKVEGKPVDLRSDGGYVLAVGSKIRGKVYEYLKGYELRSVGDLPEFPEDWLPPKKEVQGTIEPSGDRLSLITRAAAYAETMEPSISGQSGHSKLFRFACHMVRQPPHGFGLSIEETWLIALGFNSRCNPPWDEAQLKRKLLEAKRKDDE